MSKASEKETRAVVFIGGQIRTMDPEIGQVEVVVIQGDRIVEVGETSLLKSYPAAEIINLNGSTLIPGFIDAHNHLSFGCFLPGWANLRGLFNTEEVLHAIKSHAQAHPDAAWIVGFPWMDVEQGGAAFTRQDLDESGIDKPVLLIHHSFHKSVANTQALDMAGISRSSPDPQCGKIVRDSDGMPTGLLFEQAEAPLFKLALETSPGEYADMIEARARQLLPFGITAVHDPGVTPAADAAYRLLHAGGRLPVSVLMMPHGETMLDNCITKRLNGPVTGTGDEQLRVGPVKLFADGGVSGTLAFAGTIGGTPYTLGVPRDDFADLLADATSRGFRVCVHSIGNAATEAVLTAFEKAAKVAPEDFGMRPRLEHVFLMNQDQINRLATMGGCVAVQPCFLQGSQALKHFRFDGLNWFAFSDLVKGGVTVAGSSDDPGGFMDGRDPIKSAVMGATMSDAAGIPLFPEQAMSFEQWLQIFTAGAAFSGGQEHERGMLKKGLVADLVILDGELDPQNPPVVAETWKDGVRVYARRTQPGYGKIK